ncbi:hypothetical protein AVU35_gp65 [Enterobacteria phage JenK1]|uniref:Uncharacterized protein n=1 Tax=Enterobacteria phage JenK1 TaxID=1610836 RepID=A0A0E3JJ12_9CAUD|nr:hypothetical protein AVU35_gp65 [Enterobacteria phage JenK1]AKA61105.1 hypothetical protein [Enterobacteria phage JenK1]
MVGEQDLLPKWYPDYRKSDTLMRIQFILNHQTDFSLYLREELRRTDMKNLWAIKKRLRLRKHLDDLHKVMQQLIRYNIRIEESRKIWRK